MVNRSNIKSIRSRIKNILVTTGLYPFANYVKNDIPKKLFKKYDGIFCDITNVCNLRCPHCYNNWKDEYLQKKLLMNLEYFDKIKQLAPLTVKGNFLLSCAFEPTLHPEFLEILHAIPVHLQKYIAFTTNLSTKISDDIFKTLSCMQLHHINISIESFIPGIYEQCRKNARYDQFISNLERMVQFFKEQKRSPHIRFITLVTSLNIQEIRSIIQKCHTSYHAFENEIRYPWTTPGPWNTPGSIEWLKKHAISEFEWESLIVSLKDLPFRYSISPPQREDDAEQQNALKILWVRPDGLLRIQRRKKGVNFHIDEIAEPVKFFKKQLSINKY